MSDSPFFSVIIPTYNVENYIKETIDCIVSQSFTDWELVIVDDGSSDGSIEIIKSYFKEGKIRIETSACNSGNPYIVRERAAKLTRGKYIVQIDADDRVDPDFLEQLFSGIYKERGEGNDLVIPEMWRLKPDGASYKILPKNSINTEENYRGKDLVKYTIDVWEIPMAGFAVRKEIFLKAYDICDQEASKSIHTDELLSRHLLYLSQSVSFVGTRYFYRDNPGSLTNKSINKIRGGKITINDLLKFVKEKYGENSEEYQKVLRNKFFFSIDSQKSLASEKFNSQEKKEIADIIKSTRSEIKGVRLHPKATLPYRLIFTSPIKIGNGIIRLMEMWRVIKTRK